VLGSQHRTSLATLGVLALDGLVQAHNRSIGFGPVTAAILVAGTTASLESVLGPE